MKDSKKIFLLLIAVAIVFLIVKGASPSNGKQTDVFEDEITTPGNDYNTVKYVSNTNNIFIIGAKFCEKTITIIIEGIFNIIGKGFELIFGI